jgi:hypothetical protein
MSLSRRPIREVGDLPQTIPVFPLSGVLLLPRGRLPLNIFEPRYLAMTDDAMKTDDRLIGMIQPTEPERAGATQKLHRVGCAGRIVSMSETDDGRYLITLAGMCRFTIREELETMRGYRRIVPDFAAYAADLQPDPSRVADRARLRAALRGFFARHEIKADWDSIEQAPDDRLIVTLAMVCPFEPAEKQALLEAPTLAERAQTMTALLELAAVAGAGQGPRH